MIFFSDFQKDTISIGIMINFNRRMENNTQMLPQFTKKKKNIYMKM